MPLYNIRGKLYKKKWKNETFDNTITRYKRNSVYDNTLAATRCTKSIVVEPGIFPLHWLTDENDRLIRENFIRKNDCYSRVRK